MNFLGQSGSKWGWGVSELELVEREDLEELPRRERRASLGEGF